MCENLGPTHLHSAKMCILNRPLNIFSSIFKKNQIWLIPPWLGFEHENGELREIARTDEKWVGSYPLSLCPPLPLFQTKGRLFLVTFIFNHRSVWSFDESFHVGLRSHKLPWAPQPDHNRRPTRYGWSYYLPISYNIYYIIIFNIAPYFVVMYISE